MISQNPIFYNWFYTEYSILFSFQGCFHSKPRCSALSRVGFVSRFQFSGAMASGFCSVSAAGCCSSCTAGWAFCCRFRRSGVCGGCHLCRLGCGIAGGLACSGLCWVSGLCLIFLLGLLGFFSASACWARRHPSGQNRHLQYPPPDHRYGHHSLRTQC